MQRFADPDDVLKATHITRRQSDFDALRSR
jgi:hypothetical protein